MVLYGIVLLVCFCVIVFRFVILYSSKPADTAWYFALLQSCIASLYLVLGRITYYYIMFSHMFLCYVVPYYVAPYKITWQHTVSCYTVSSHIAVQYVASDHSRSYHLLYSLCQILLETAYYNELYYFMSHNIMLCCTMQYCVIVFQYPYIETNIYVLCCITSLLCSLAFFIGVQAAGFTPSSGKLSSTISKPHLCAGLEYSHTVGLQRPCAAMAPCTHPESPVPLN